jgi:hypothetical protein
VPDEAKLYPLKDPWLPATEAGGPNEHRKEGRKRPSPGVSQAMQHSQFLLFKPERESWNNPTAILGYTRSYPTTSRSH